MFGLTKTMPRLTTYLPLSCSFDPLGLKPTDAEELKTLETKELNNGRLAMIAIAGFVVQVKVENVECIMMSKW